MPFLDYLTKDELETKLGVLGRENSIRLGGDMENRSLLGTILPVDIIRILRCMTDLVNHVQFVKMLSEVRGWGSEHVFLLGLSKIMRVGYWNGEEQAHIHCHCSNIRI